MLEAIKRQFKVKPLATVSTVVGIITGVIGIVAFGGTAMETLDEYIVSNEELTIAIDGAESRIIVQIQKEALITRNAIVGELQIRKNHLNKALNDAESDGEVARILQELKELNERMNRMKGVIQ